MASTKKTAKIFLLVAPLLFIVSILTYYQFFYKSPRVNNGIVGLVLIFSKHTNTVTAVRFNPNDSLLITGSVDSTIKIWERATGKIVRNIKQPTGIAYLDVSKDGKYIATGGYDSTVRVWRLSDGALVKELKGHGGTVWTVAFSPDGKKIASSGDDAVIKIWDLESGTVIHQMKGHKRVVWSVKFNLDGTKIASGSFDHTIKMWNVNNGKLLWNNSGHSEAVVDITFSHNGNYLASTSDDKTIKLWDIATHKLLRTMHVAEHMQAVAFSPNDKRLLTGGRDKPMIGEFLQELFGDSKLNSGVSARLWDVETGTLLQTFTRHRNDVLDLAISHDGKWIGTASEDKTVELWKVIVR